MKRYPQERIDMILVTVECEENCSLASRIYAQRNHTDRWSLLQKCDKRSVAYVKQKDENRL